ncbi:MAG: AI-2E family transporter [Lachnospiraceae bacterium]
MYHYIKKYILIFFIAAIFFAGVLYLQPILGGIMKFLGVLRTLMIGAMIAFVLNVPMSKINSLLIKLISKTKLKIKKSTILLLSLILSLVILALVIILAATVLIPNLILTIVTIIEVMQEQIPAVLEWIKSIEFPVEEMNTYIQNLDFPNLQGTITGFLGSSLSNIVAMTTSTISNLVSIGFGFIIALYILLDKERMGRIGTQLIEIYLPKKSGNYLIKTGKLLNDTYSKFLTGQCVEAVIICILLFISLSIFKIPYASLISVMAAIFSFVPYIGSFVACFAGALFIVVLNPYLALLEIIVFQVVQFVEGQFIYPRVVGSSVGLPPLLTLLAALIGGKLFGILGMIFFIPLVAVIFILVREDMEKRMSIGTDLEPKSE